MRLRGLALALLAWPLAAQDFSGVELEKVAAKLGYADGPAWARDGYLLFSDIPGEKIMKFTPGEGVTVFREQSNGAAGNAFDAQGRLYTCESKARRVTRTDAKGHVEVLAERFEGKRFNAPNDIAVSRNGHVYFTDPAFGYQQDRRELDFYGVFHITPKGEVSAVAKPAGRPNGVVLSPNGRILYVTNSDDRTISAYDVDHSGSVTGERTLVSGTDGIPDGIRVDEKGNLYVAAKGILVYSPDGKLRATIPVAETPSNLAFGDGDFRSLYITARRSVFRVRLP